MRRIKEPEVRKNEILDAAHKLFAEKGYSKTTVIDIMMLRLLTPKRLLQILILRHRKSCSRF